MRQALSDVYLMGLITGLRGQQIQTLEETLNAVFQVASGIPAHFAPPLADLCIAAEISGVGIATALPRGVSPADVISQLTNALQLHIVRTVIASTHKGAVHIWNSGSEEELRVVTLQRTADFFEALRCVEPHSKTLFKVLVATLSAAWAELGAQCGTYRVLSSTEMLLRLAEEE